MSSANDTLNQAASSALPESSGVSSSVENNRGITRRFSSLEGLSNGHKLDVRAHQRTYEGAYTRTAVGSLAFSIMIIKLFSKEFLPIGTIYTIYGFILFCFGMYKTRSVDVYYNPVKDKEFYKTSGNSVMMLTGISVLCYLVLFVLIMVM